MPETQHEDAVGHEVFVADKEGVTWTPPVLAAAADDEGTVVEVDVGPFPDEHAAMASATITNTAPRAGALLPMVTPSGDGDPS